MKSCLPPQHNYSEIHGTVLPVRKNCWFLNGISQDDLTLMLCFLVRAIICFFVQSSLLTSIPLCVFYSIVTCDVHCKQHKLSRWDLFALRANVVINKKNQYQQRSSVTLTFYFWILVSRIKLNWVEVCFFKIIYIFKTVKKRRLRLSFLSLVSLVMISRMLRLTISY